MGQCPVDLKREMDSLKDFQRRTAEYAFERLFLDTSGSKRFLVADEVGLGKTMVAKGIIAQTVDHLWKQGNKKIDIIYLCSNQSIASQNIARLNILSTGGFTEATRLTLLARRPIETQLKVDEEQRVKFVSLTPGTSFDPRGTALGLRRERVLLYHLLHKFWKIEGIPAQNVWTGNADADNFRLRVASFQEKWIIDKDVAKNAKALFGKSLRSEYEYLCERFARKNSSVNNEDLKRRKQFVATARTLLAKASVDVLSPDLIIMDEFQRFRHLLSEETPAGQLAHDLFNYSDHESKARVLLLSATPYKMYTISAEKEADDHYHDLSQMIAFLMANPADAARCKDLLSQYRTELRCSLSAQGQHLLSIKTEIEALLSSVMARTERGASGIDRNGMLTDICKDVPVGSDDLLSYCGMQKIASSLGCFDVMEYWKSAPYLFNFMEGYQLKDELMAALKDKRRAALIYKQLKDTPEILLDPATIRKWRPVPLRNARLRALARDTVHSGAWSLLWVPPLAACYQLAAPFDAEGVRDFTKRLVFSSWRVVPKAVAGLLSYETERLARLSRGTALTKEEFALLRFAKTDGRPVGMPVFTLIYPCLFLASSCDPHLLSAEAIAGGEQATIQNIHAAAKSVIDSALQSVMQFADMSESIDERWYWAAPLLLDLQHSSSQTRHWLDSADVHARWTGVQKDEDASAAWVDHFTEFRRIMQDKQLGKPPEDLSDLLAWVALGSPATCALRSLRTLCEQSEYSIEHQEAAAVIGWAFRNHFNRPHAQLVIRSNTDASVYWQSVLHYAANGCLQSVLDEYLHILVDALGLHASDSAEKCRRLSLSCAAALEVRPSVINADVFDLDDAAGTVRVREEPMKINALFAIPLIEERDQKDGLDEAGISRVTRVQQAFNSPFWPFVLASTSIGQEGLDFHQYCHAVVHWNLPANPVDMEQREGRVHRYKGHAVRKNIAKKYSYLPKAADRDHWRTMFEQAKQDKHPEQSELVPYWMYPLPGGARVERHVPMIPFSRDEKRLNLIRRTLAVYRMVFGQPRQDDLVEYILSHHEQKVPSELEAICEDVSICLAPPGRQQDTVPARVNEKKADEV